MSYRRHSLTAIVTLLAAVALMIISFSPEGSGYKFPQLVSVAMVVIAAILALLALVPKKPITKANEESVPWGTIWPVLLILAGFLLVMEWLGFFATSFIAFFLLVMTYSPERMCWRHAIKGGLISAVFMGVLYLIFVSLLSVQAPQGVLI